MLVVRICKFANRNGENPCALASEFFAFTHRERAKSKSLLVFSRVLFKISDRIRLCCSTNSLLKGYSTVGEINFIFIDLRMSKNFTFVNLPPFSDIDFPATLYNCICEKNGFNDRFWILGGNYCLCVVDESRCSVFNKM